MARRAGKPLPTPSIFTPPPGKPLRLVLVSSDGTAERVTVAQVIVELSGDREVIINASRRRSCDLSLIAGKPNTPEQFKSGRAFKSSSFVIRPGAANDVGLRVERTEGRVVTREMARKKLREERVRKGKRS